MQVVYDTRADTLSIILSDRPVTESDEEKPGVILDYDAEGNLVSMEILDASIRVNQPTSTNPSGGECAADRYTPPMHAHKLVVVDHALYDREAPKKPAKVSVNGELLEKARELGVDLASTLEDALALAVYRRQREVWLEENREAIEAYNEHVAQHGVFSTGLRGF